MELRVVETFLIVAEQGSFSAAAQRLGYSQSAVTMQIKQLEQELGARLFDRERRGVALTDQGRAFAFHAHELMSAADRAVASVQAQPVAGEVVGTVRVGSVESISTAILPELLVRFHRAYPRVQVVVRTASKARLVRAVQGNELDLLLTMENLLSLDGLRRTVLREEETVFVAAPEVAAQVGELTAEALPDVPLVLTERGESYRHELERRLAERDERLRPIVEAGNTETLVHLAERGAGVAFLPRFCVAGALRSGALVELPARIEPVRMFSQLFVHRYKWITPALEAFIGCVEETFGCAGGER